MTNCLEIKKTTSLLHLIAATKASEISDYEKKVQELKEVLSQDPNNLVKEYKYYITKMRLDQLKRTTKGLNKLEQKLVNFQM
ncbi:MAG: hypothetical protein AB8B52_08120 [Winogradskyella sp.]|uniref:hypothetical protein n=1 Tax=Winogradskyella sp. TaxID=1883156 RepID=UPI00385D3031